MIERLNWLRHNFSIPQDHRDYLNTINIKPQVIYDIGSCTLHWHDAAKKIWPHAEIICFDAIYGAEEFYQQAGVKFYSHLLSDQDHDILNFWANPHHPAGNSSYRENPTYSPDGQYIYSDDFKTVRMTRTLDSLAQEKNLPLPDLIKLDVQGSELNILKGSSKVLEHCLHIICEVQSKPYNVGAPFESDVTNYLKTQNFELVNARFSGNHIQGDAHYQKI